MRVTLDWVLTIAGAILIVLAIKHWVVNPYRIPSSSMEPTLHCARPGTRAARRDSSDRVLAYRFFYHFSYPAPRRHRRLQHADAKPPRQVRRGRHVREAADRPARRDRARGRQSGFIWSSSQDGEVVKLKEPYITASAGLPTAPHFGRPGHVPQGEYFFMGDNRVAVVRLPRVGRGAAQRT